ncbi:MAG TPA: NTP transferase domain-containing protein [Dongiaceae bacterium]|nr:NTP transferase domain-containing protein [Dongiaceae bacterium]
MIRRSHPHLAAVILAAGYSSRMGQFKPRLPLGNRSAIEHAISTFQRAGVEDIIVVTGHRARELATVLEGQCVNCIFNPKYETGMYSSIVAGIEALSREVEAVFILPADIPLIRSSTISKLSAAYEAGQALVTYPVFQNRRGHPPLIKRALFTEIVADGGTCGLRGVLNRFAGQSATVTVLDEAIHLDMDTAADYARMSALAPDRDVLSESECKAVVGELKVPEAVVRHCRAVAQAAVKIGASLIQHGEALNLALIRAGALLHDVAKGKPDHAQAGANMLDALGFPTIAQIIASHEDLPFRDGIVDEAAVVYLADKLVRDEKVVTLLQRFEASFQRYRDDSEVLPLVERRWKTAQQISATVEQRCGASLAEMLASSENHTAATQGVQDQGNVLRGVTESVCPVCLARIESQRIAENNDVYLIKTCAAHGRFKTVIWRGEPSYQSWALASRRETKPPVPSTAAGPGCPFECGLCPDHRQRTCCVLLEVTNRCNLACPFCFASSPTSKTDPGLEEVENWLRMLLASGGPFNLQLSGGEPTLRDDLPEIITLARRMGFSFIQINTNGIRLAQDDSYLQRLKMSGLGCVFLQFDGVTDAVYQRIRGKALFAIKERVIQRCRAQQIGVVLVPTLVPGVNIDQIGEIIRLAVQQIPTVRAVHFQPVSYFGRYPDAPSDANRITLPEVMLEIERQSHQQIHVADFYPPSAENAYCSFQGRFTVASDGRLIPSAKRQTSCCGPGTSENALVKLGSGSVCSHDESKRARLFVARQWAFPASDPSAAGADSVLNTPSLDAFLREVQLNTLTISGMAFQDAWNLDLERLRECFLHIVSPDRRLVPLCAYNLTDLQGRSLYGSRENSRAPNEAAHV